MEKKLEELNTAKHKLFVQLKQVVNKDEQTKRHEDSKK